MKFRRYLGLLVSVAAGCSSEAARLTEPPTQDASAEPARGRAPRVVVEEVKFQTFVDRLNVNGTVLTSRDVVLSAQVEGTLLRVAALGERIPKGGLVAQLDPELAEASLAQAQASQQVARAQYMLAKQNYDRQQPLFEREVISPLEFERLTSQLQQTEAALAQAQAGVRQAQERLGRTRVVAPFTGTVEERYAEAGEQVNPSSRIARLVNTERVRVRGAVPERYAQDIKVGQLAQVRFSAYGIPPREAPVTFVGRAIDPGTRTFPVEVELGNPEGALKPEMVARLRLERATLEKAMAVPQNAVLTDDRGESVFVIRRDGEVTTVERRRVETGLRSEGSVVIEEGLSEGDLVVVVGQTNINTSDRVEVQRRAEAP